MHSRIPDSAHDATDSWFFVYIPIEQGKKPAASWLQSAWPRDQGSSPAFHTISEVKLKNTAEGLDADTFICGDDANVVAKLSELVSDKRLGPYLGPLSLTYQAEVLTPMLLNAARRNKMKHPGVKLT